MKRTLVVALIAVVATVVMTACGVSRRGVASAKPTLTGGIRFVGRVPPSYTATGYQRGLVQVLREGKVVTSASLSQGQDYRFVLSPGSYLVRTWGNAKPPYPPCPLSAVTIRAARTSHVNVYCMFH